MLQPWCTDIRYVAVERERKGKRKKEMSERERERERYESWLAEPRAVCQSREVSN